jgi:hypothetical protein
MNSDVGTGGLGGGGNAGAFGTAAAGLPGTVNTGGGGGAGSGQSGVTAAAAGAGGSGVVIFKISDTATVTFSAGVTEENGGAGESIGDYKVYTITAAGPTDTVTIS